MNARLLATALSVLTGAVVSTRVASSAVPAKTFGGIAGVVSNSLGVPQMGATVLLYNRFDRELRRSLTSETGVFSFKALAPDVYAVRVSLVSFLPALKRDIVVQPGMQSLLNVNMATVFSSIELVAVSPGQTSLMSDEWRWVLRSSAATRPVLRLFPDLKSPYPQKSAAEAMFSDTTGVVRVSAGDEGDAADSMASDLGTAFAFATCFRERNRFQVSGNVGYAAMSGTPAAAFQTSFRRELAEGFSTPEVKLTMRQLPLPLRAGALNAGDDPMLRSLSASVLDSKELAHNIRVEYGMSLDSITFLDRLNYMSSFARVTYEVTPSQTVRVAYSSGTPPVEAYRDDREAHPELQQNLTSLAFFPRVSLLAGRARVQDTQSMEAGYRKKAGSRTYALAAYDDQVWNAAVTITGIGDGLGNGDLLPDLFASSWTWNAGRFGSLGYMASVTQDLTQNINLSVIYGGDGALTVDRKRPDPMTTQDVRSALRTDRRQSVTARVSGTSPGSGTKFAVSYQWANILALNPAHMYLTQDARNGLGLNLQVRQPIPYFGGLPGHVEATAEMRNLLAQGYVPLTCNGQRLYMMQSPRSVRGGLNFTF
jgi:hypothetical protein